MKLDRETARLLDQLDQLLHRFVAFPSEHARYAVAAWTLHTWCLDAFDSTPRLAALSPEKGSGKTRLLEVLELVVPKAIHSVNMSASVLFRLVGGEELVTLLMDEADTYLGWKVAKEHEDIRGLVNAGHRRGATAYRMQMEGGAQVVAFPAFAPVALAGIGDLPDTILDRSIVIPMKRRAPSEVVESFRRRLVGPEVVNLVERLEAWGDEVHHQLELAIAELELPAGIEDRAADVWEPLVALADLAGDPWAGRVREAAVALNGQREARDPSLGVQLLRDVRDVFDRLDVDRLTSQQLVAELVTIEGAPWPNLRGMPIDANGIARRLKPYEVRPGAHWIDGATHRGYLREDFWDAWQRYLPPLPESHKAHKAHKETADSPTSLTDLMPPQQGCRGCGEAADRTSATGSPWCSRCWEDAAGGAA